MGVRVPAAGLPAAAAPTGARGAAAHGCRGQDRLKAGLKKNVRSLLSSCTYKPDIDSLSSVVGVESSMLGGEGDSSLIYLVAACTYKPDRGFFSRVKLCSRSWLASAFTKWSTRTLGPEVGLNRGVVEALPKGVWRVCIIVVGMILCRCLLKGARCDKTCNRCVYMAARACIYIYMCIDIDIDTRTYIYIYIYIYIMYSYCIHTYIHTNICIYAYEHAHTHVYIHIYTHTPTYTRTHTYTGMRSFSRCVPAYIFSVHVRMPAHEYIHVYIYIYCRRHAGMYAETCAYMCMHLAGSGLQRRFQFESAVHPEVTANGWQKEQCNKTGVQKCEEGAIQGT